jgi:hypothetical protein
MALIACEECGKQISDKAHHCVNCGMPIQSATAAPVTIEDQSLYADVGVIKGQIISYSAATRSGKIRDRTTDEEFEFLADNVEGLTNPDLLVGQIREYDFLSDGKIFIRQSQQKQPTSDQPSATHTQMQHELTMPNGVRWFERLMAGSIALGLLFVKMPSAVAGFGIGTAVITLLFVFWASRGRSNFAKWLNGISVALGTVMVIPVLQSASMYGNPLVGNLVYGSQGGLLLLQTLMQISAIALLFGNDSKKWFEKQDQ